MAKRKPRKTASTGNRDAISEHASDWIRIFAEQLEDHFVDLTPTIPANARFRQYQDATIRAVLETLLDSGMDVESFAETVGQFLIEKRLGRIEWNPDLNRRRFELIDKKIQEALTPDERMELAGLTRIMREQLESEANIPMEGAKELHQKLLELAVRGKRH
jgi:hypothetical protein